MKVIINRREHELPSPATLQDALAAVQAQPPFAVAVNLQFVPKSQYATQLLVEGDCIEVIAPVTGG